MSADTRIGIYPKDRENESLSMFVMGNLLAAVGNDETKAIVSTALQPNVMYDKYAINSRMREVLAGRHSPYAGHTLFFDYLSKSFSELGIVNPSGDTDEYSLSPLGLREGRSLAGHLLHFSETHPNVSLYKLFGSTSSAAETTNTGEEYKKRAPFIRYKILSTLATKQLPLRILDIARATHEDKGNVSSHLKQLRSSGILSYDSVTSNEPIVIYSPTNQEPSSEYFAKQRTPRLASDAYNAVVTEYRKDGGQRSVYLDDLLPYLPIREGGNMQHGQSTINRRYKVLEELVRDGFLKTARFNGFTRSEVSLSEKQQEQIVDIVAILTRFQSQDPTFLQEGVSLGNEILADPQRVYRLMEKARDVSTYANKIDYTSLSTIVLALLSSSEHPTGDLQASVEQTLGRSISRFHFSSLLGKMTDEGKIVGRMHKNYRYWHLPSTSEK